jgi:hypothetical protein
LQFEHPASREVLSVGPAPYFVVRGGELLAGPGEEPVGHYQDGLWHAGGRSFTAVTPDAPTAVRFEANGGESCVEERGPFEHVKLIDGAIRHGPRLGRLLAKFDEGSQSWVVYPGRKTCHTAVLAPAGAAP